MKTKIVNKEDTTLNKKYVPNIICLMFFVVICLLFIQPVYSQIIVNGSGFPEIYSLTPSSGPVGTTVIITGSGFSTSSNLIYFKPEGDTIFRNQTAASSRDTATLTFTIQAYINPYCRYTTPPCAAPSISTTPGTYEVYVFNGEDETNKVPFIVTGTQTPEPTPVITPPPGDCTSGTPISVPFSHNGTGTFCWEAASLGSFINSWNLDVLEVNGVDLTNRWVHSSNLPPKINGKYYVFYKSSLPWGHFEAK
jgi:hypothetical protein